MTALAHIALNNSASSFSYFAVVQNQMLANIGLALTMAVVVAVLYFKKELEIFPIYFHSDMRADDAYSGSLHKPLGAEQNGFNTQKIGGSREYQSDQRKR